MSPRAVLFLIPALILVFAQVMAQSTLRKTTPFAQNENTSANDRKAGEILIERASLTTPDGETIPFELGTLYVPENRSDPKARIDRKSTRLNSSHMPKSRMPSSA